MYRGHSIIGWSLGVGERVDKWLCVEIELVVSSCCRTAVSWSVPGRCTSYRSTLSVAQVLTALHFGVTVRSLALCN